MKVYVVMSTSYGELLGIEKVFLYKEKAELYVLQNKDNISYQLYLEEVEVIE